MNIRESLNRQSRSIFWLALFILIYGNLFSQVNPDINFYPLHVGDVWQYYVEYDSDFDEEDTTYYLTKKVIGKEVINDKQYFVIEGSDHSSLVSYRYVRIDTQTANLWNYWNENEVMSDSLSSSKGDLFIKSGYGVICFEDSISTILGTETRVKSFREEIVVTSGRGGSTYTYAEGFGCVEYSWPFAYIVGASGRAKLVYAKINNQETGTLVDVSTKFQNTPYDFSLTQNFPNPFNPSTKIIYTIGNNDSNVKSHVSLKVYDILGRNVATLVDDIKTKGTHEVTFNAENLNSGVYYYQIISDSFVDTKKMILLK